MNNKAGHAGGPNTAVPVNYDALAARLRGTIKGEVRFDGGSRALYSADASNYRQVPIGVVVPRSVEDIVETVAACRESDAPILARGGGTSMCGQSVNMNLFPGDPQVAKLAKQTFNFSEFLVRQARYTPAPLQVKAIVHGHCHQKAIFGMGDEVTLLGAMGVDFDLLDSGCCGMAGSFGFDKDKVELSKRIGEMVLLPEVRAAARDTLIVTNGYSCREQIAQGAKREAMHLAEVIDLAIQRHGSARPRLHHAESRVPDVEIE